MCEPVTIALGVAAAVTAVGGIQASKAARKQGAEAARQGQFNAQMAEYAAADAERRGQREAATVMRQSNTLLGEQRAAAAANGVTSGYGTLAEAAAQTDFFAALDKNTALDNAAHDAWTARTQGAEAMRAGQSAQAQAKASSNAILLNTGVSLAGQWFQGSGGSRAPAGASGGSYSISGSAGRG